VVEEIMLATTAEKLKPGDVFTADNGESWWKLECNDRDPQGRRLFSRCVEANDDAEVAPGDVESAVYNDDHEVLVRI
jgi:hypothetical protein